MQVGSASTAGRRSSVRTRTVARVRPSDSLPPLSPQRSLTTGSISTPHGGAYATTARDVLHWPRKGLPPGQLRIRFGQHPCRAAKNSEGMLPYARSPRGPVAMTRNARYLCRTCLVREWDQSPHEIDHWLTLHHSGAARAANYQWWASNNSRSAWHGQWGNSSHGSGWNYSSGKWT